MKRARKWMNKAVNAIFGLAALLVLYVLAQILLFATFKIPSDSMEPTLIEGDVISVCKPALGARIFNIWTALKGEEVDVYRLSGFSKVRRDDILVFNFPYSEWNQWDENMKMNISNYYVKRCVAVPGDTLFIHDGIYMIGDGNVLAGNIESQKRIMKFNPDNIPDEILHASFRQHCPMEHQRVRSFLYTGKERFHSNEQNKLPSVQKNNSVGTG